MSPKTTAKKEEDDLQRKTQEKKHPEIEIKIDSSLNALNYMIGNVKLIAFPIFCKNSSYKVFPFSKYFSSYHRHAILGFSIMKISIFNNIPEGIPSAHVWKICRLLFSTKRITKTASHFTIIEINVVAYTKSVDS
jgi:hypothetical protein